MNIIRWPRELEEREAEFTETEEGELIAAHARLAGMATASTEIEEPIKHELCGLCRVLGITGIVICVLGVAAILYGALR